MLFEVITWVLFGATIGGLFAFFMERRGYSVQHSVAGIAGALVGGVLGYFVETAIPALGWYAGSYSFTRLLFSMIFAVVAVEIDRKTFRRGKHLVRDPRPDVP